MTKYLVPRPICLHYKISSSNIIQEHERWLSAVYDRVSDLEREVAVQIDDYEESLYIFGHEPEMNARQEKLIKTLDSTIEIHVLQLESIRKDLKKLRQADRWSNAKKDLNFIFI